MAKRLDIVIFGATGYTGKVAVEKIVSLAKKRSNLTWGVAGRSQEKLAEMLEEVAGITKSNLKDVKIVVANIDDEQSLKTMAKMCKVLVNCVGPYRHWGEQTVKACIESGTHHVDVSGEPEYMEKMQLLYHKQAEEKGVYVVSACGFDSVPAEVGCLHFMKQFDGDVNSVESYLTLSNSGKQEGASINYATWESMVYGMAHAKDLGPLRKKLHPHRLPLMAPKLRARGSVFRNPIGSGWCMPFLGSDQSVMRRSQHFFHEKKGQRPLQIQCYFTIPSFSHVLSFLFAGVFLSILTKFNWGQKLLLAHPKFFTRGFVSRDGPTTEIRKNTEFSITFVGDGWSEKKSDGIQNNSTPDFKVVTKISGIDPAYGLAAISVLLCAVTIIDESENMPGKGGVYPPAAAFCETKLISELQSNGITMEVIEKKKNVLKNKL